MANYPSDSRCLSFDERPLAIKRQVDKLGIKIMFILKHIRVNDEAVTGRTITQSSTAISVPTALPLPRRSIYGPSIAVGDSVVAIYEYKAEKEDEFDIIIGDRFLISNIVEHWCILKNAERSAWGPMACFANEFETQTRLL